MVENKNETFQDWIHFLFGVTSGCVIGCTSLIFIKQLLDGVMENRSQLEADIKKATNEFVESLKDTRDKVYNDATEECLSGIRKDLEDDVEKYLTRTREKLEVDVEVVLGSVRKVLEADFENNKRGTPSDRDTLIDAIDECLTDIKKLMQVKVE